ncbi:DNA circularization protein [Aeromonas enteropelogenes]|uniref:DNA circularization protein n=1 Tax=Aeromonas enteropelogenes TaxID=29489 RepID=UPI003BA1403C
MMATSSAISDGSGNYQTTLGSGKGSFRGASFLIVDDVSQRGGQRTVRREFPLRSNGGADSLGSKMRERTFKCIVLGSGYIAERDALIAALDKPGQGELVHPLWGTIQVVIDSWDSVESLSAQGVCTFTITCLPPLSSTAPVVSVDTEQQVGAGADAADNAAQGDFTDAWSVDDLSLSDIETVIDSTTDTIQGIKESVDSMLSWVDDVQTVLGKLDELKGEVENLIYTPARLASDLSGIISSVRSLCSVSDAIATYKHMAARLDLSVSTAGASLSSVQLYRHNNKNMSRALRGQAVQVRSSAAASVQALANIEALDFLVEALLLAAMTITASDALGEAQTLAAERRISRLQGEPLSVTALRVTRSARQTPESRQQINMAAAVLAQAWEDVAMKASPLRWAKTAATAWSVRLALISDAKTRGEMLPRSITITPTRTEPALVTTYRALGDCRDWQTTARRNGVPNPLFMPGGEQLEVLSDE